MKPILIFMILTPIFAEEFIAGTNQFAADVYRELTKLGEENFLVSPFSAVTVLALAQSGARGETARELTTTLHLPDQNQTEAAFKSLLPSLKAGNDVYSFYTANKLYLKENFTIKEEFKRVAIDVFGSDLENIDFTQTVDAANKMNQWVEDKTEDKIHDLINPGVLNNDTRAVLLNALFFRANWSTPFTDFLTTKKNFYRIDKKLVEVDTMTLFEHKKLKFAENEALGAKFLELSFEGGDVSMVFVLPNEKDGITNLEKQIDKVFVAQNFKDEFVNISIPKFKIESRIDVKQILKNLGVTQAFSEELADFTGISDSLIAISDAVQKSFIDVNESGVEAAAATYIGLVDIRFQEEPTNLKQFHADHPFIFFIKIKNLIIFAGRVGIPKY